MTCRGLTRADVVVVLGILLVLGCLGLPLAPGPILFVGLLAFGWIGYVVRVLPNVQPDWGAVALWATCLAMFTAGLHWLLRWFYAALRQTSLADSPLPQKTAIWSWRWTGGVVAILVMLFVAGISMVGIMHQAAWLATATEPILHSDFGGSRRIRSSNNLSQLGRALNEYEVNKLHLPPGVRTSDEGQALHGWITALLPLIRPDLAELVDRSRPWHEEQNKTAFSARVSVLLIAWPGLPSVNDEGYALTHYSGNMHVLGGTRAWKLGEFTDGAANTILAGEAAGNFKPWGHPRNWRDPAAGLNASPDGFGGPWHGGGAQFVMADGSVRFISADVDPAVLRALATPAAGDQPPVDQ